MRPEGLPCQGILGQALFNNALFSNTLVLGHLARTIDALDKEVVLESILEIIPKFHDKNKKAYEIGYKYKS
jgi:Pyruvate/2-oxoacid:ferredoxin oxidoreductase gamma subunit